MAEHTPIKLCSGQLHSKLTMGQVGAVVCSEAEGHVAFEDSAIPR
jgi:hypothetical protein